MKFISVLVLLVGVLIGACAPQAGVPQNAAVEVKSAAETIAAQTQESGRAQAGTTGAATPASDSAAPPPVATKTFGPSPTPSGQYEFFDVKVDQVAPDEVDVSFGFQLPQDVQLGEVQLGAWPVGCDDLLYSLSLVPNIPFSYSGWAQGDEVVQLSLDEPGKCDSSAIQLMVYQPDQPGNLYQQTFDIPFSLAKQ